MNLSQRHNSMRGWFAYELYQHMKKNRDIFLLVGDLGYRIFDAHFQDFPDHCVNTGAAEQAMIDIACGLAVEGKIPFVYSITTFLLYRPFEGIRNYIDGEKLNVKLVGSGRDFDYEYDGFSHHPLEAKRVLQLFSNIQQIWPEEKEEIPGIVEHMVQYNKPYFLSLRR